MEERRIWMKFLAEKRMLKQSIEKINSCSRPLVLFRRVQNPGRAISGEGFSFGCPAKIPEKCDSGRRIPFAFQSSARSDSAYAPGEDNKRWTNRLPVRSLLLQTS